MMDKIKKISVSGWCVLASALLAFIGMIVFAASATTGFLGGQKWSAAPVVCTVIMVLVAAALVFFGDKLGKFAPACLFVVLALLLTSLMIVFTDRMEIISDVYFIPVNHPASEDVAMTNTIVSLVFYILSTVALIVAGFGKGLKKQDV